jgi:hypothetical protein
LWGIDTSPIRYEVDENFFLTIDSEEKAYWLGFLIADGNVYNTMLRIELAIKDINHLHKFAASLNSSHRVVVTKNGTAALIRITNRKLIKDLVKYGMVPNKTKIAYPPQLPSHLMVHFWRGIIDGDGSVGIWSGDPSLYLCGTKAICDGFKNFCKSFTDSKASVRKIGEDFYSYTLTGRKATPIMNVLYGDSKVYLERKYASAMKILNDYS